MTTNNTDLDDVEPRRAVDLYLETRHDELSNSSLTAHRRRLKHFVRWCETEREIESMAELTGRSLLEYRLWRQEDGDLKPVSLQTQLSTLRVFLKFCDDIDCIVSGLWDKVPIPKIDDDDNRRDKILETERAEQILNHLQKFQYASAQHAIFLVMWHTGIRLGAVHGLDLDDYSPSEARLALHHRPETETPLKNGTRGERYVALSSEIVAVLNDYIEHHRYDRMDNGGREPLFTTPYGRYARTSIRRMVYQVTQPCFSTNECPHGKEIETCEHREFESTNLCPSSIAPHDIRRGAITHFLLNDVPENIVGGRMNVSADVLDKHYEKRTEEQRMEQRRGYLDNV